MDLEMEGDTEALASSAEASAPAELEPQPYDERDIAVIRALQGDMPVVPEPYAPAAAEIGITIQCVRQRVDQQDRAETVPDEHDFIGLPSACAGGSRAIPRPDAKACNRDGRVYPRGRRNRKDEIRTCATIPGARLRSCESHWHHRGRF